MRVDPEQDAPEAPGAPTRKGRRPRGVQGVAEHRRRIITVSLSVASCVLLVNSIVGQNGYLATLRARAEEARLEATVGELRRENQRLQQEARRLESDPTALEETARRSLGLVRPGETVLVIRDRVPAPPSPAAR